MGTSSPPPFTPSSLQQETSVTRLDDATFSAHLSPAYCIGTVHNGGYVASVFLRAAKAYMTPRGQPDAVAVHWQFLSRTQAGPAVLKVAETKMGRGMSVLHMTLHQRGLVPETPWLRPAEDGEAEGGPSPAVVAYVTNTNMDTEAGISLPTGWTLSYPPPAVDLARLGQRSRSGGGGDEGDANWKRMYIGLMKRLPMLNNLEYYMPRAGHPLPATQDLWIRFANGEPFSDTSLGFVADAVAAMLLEAYRRAKPSGGDNSSRKSAAAGFWYPTVSMSLEVKKKLPPQGAQWLRLRAAAKVIRNGRFDAQLLVFDVDDELVAMSSQVAMAVDLARNFANRGQPPRSRGKL
ncbi:hypothetical protein CDD83_7115 [Cordyceps sp. RAO-2017]|nr:hypothetical protein CDD83_7115 [Cordyceps sp. RAO-2017]